MGSVFYFVFLNAPMSVLGLFPVSFLDGYCMEHLYAHLVFWFSVVLPWELSLSETNPSDSCGVAEGQLVRGEALHYHCPPCVSLTLPVAASSWAPEDSLEWTRWDLSLSCCALWTKVSWVCQVSYHWPAYSPGSKSLGLSFLVLDMERIFSPLLFWSLY